MNKYPLIQLFADVFSGKNTLKRKAKKRLTREEQQRAEVTIQLAKEKRARKKAKRAQQQ